MPTTAWCKPPRHQQQPARCARKPRGMCQVAGMEALCRRGGRKPPTMQSLCCFRAGGGRDSKGAGLCSWPTEGETPSGVGEKPRLGRGLLSPTSCTPRSITAQGGVSPAGLSRGPLVQTSLPTHKGFWDTWGCDLT